MCEWFGGFRELDIPTRSQVNSLPVKSAVCCVVTHNNKFLITAESAFNGCLTKWSIRSKKELYTWKSGVDQHVAS